MYKYIFALILWICVVISLGSLSLELSTGQPFTPLTKNIDEYQVIYSANTFVPRIGLISNGANIGQPIFEPNGSVLPEDTITDNQVQMYYHQDDFKNIIDLLRNEKSINLVYNGGGGGFENSIQTTPEPVG